MLIANPLSGLQKYKIYLASGSPRRRELLSMLDIPFTVSKLTDCDESYPPSLPVEEIPEYLAVKKSQAFIPEDDENWLCITADTIVIINGLPVGKPVDASDAKRMLECLSNRRHTVITGVALRTREKSVSFSARSEVDFDVLTSDEIDYYVENYSPLDKAGAYGIQEWIGGVAIKGINGSYYNIMGLPLHRLYVELKAFTR